MIGLPTLKKLQERKAVSLIVQDAEQPKPLILVVEDHEDTRSLLKLMLEKLNFRVVEAADGKEAVQLAIKTRPDLILMDVRMPQINGLAAARLMRETATLCKTPIVFLSASADQASRTAAFTIDVSSYLVKPLGLAELETTIYKHLPKVSNWEIKNSTVTQILQGVA